MNITKIYVPDNVEYISDWGGYRLPLGQSIIDKTICGCGFTEFCLRRENPDNIILCSPRIVLLENKYEQHPGEPNIYYYQNECVKSSFEEYFKESGGRVPSLRKPLSEEEQKIYNREKFKFSSGIIRNHYIGCKTRGLPCRILCTYDSFHSIKNILQEALGDFHVVVDEFQSLFIDAFFKADVENQFLDDLQGVPNVTYLSATPMLEKYLDELDEFKNLPYYKLEWPSGSVTTARIQERWVSDVNKEVLNIIDIYRNRPLEKPFREVNGSLVSPNEAVFYVNSVSMIKNIIQRAKLTPREVNIVCSNTPGNRKKIKSIPGDFDIGKIPSISEPRKMFTFCTRTAYLGADFYSTSAMTYVASDANVQSLVVDIRLDLPQILGRQRLRENPWKNDCVIFYKTLSDGNIITEEEFRKNMESKKKDSMEVLNDQNQGKLSEGTKKLCIKQIMSNSSLERGQTDNYLSLNKNGDIVYNYFLELAEKRAWELSQFDYRTSMSVKSSIGDLNNIVVSGYTSLEEDQAQKFIDDLKKVKRFDERLRYYCEFREGTKDNPRLTERLLVYYQGTDLENFYSVFGIDQCKALGFRPDRLRKLLSDELNGDVVKSGIHQRFVLKEKYSLKVIKEMLKDLYSELSINKTAKASDILEYFVVKEVSLVDPNTGKRLRGYQLISLK